MLFTLTDSKAWQKAERRHDELRTSVETAFSTSSACMMIVDPADNVVTVANESLCSLLGYSRGDLTGRSTDDIDI
ncbi:PAS domain-containing protein [Sphingomonas sp. 4RDLI-65]|uniref:PAS domain S-box protein n=1 Tax=Sphingomonas sp. 4RDLI-65 TaxID=3111641 RepID=UPI003C20A5DA